MLEFQIEMSFMWDDQQWWVGNEGVHTERMVKPKKNFSQDTRQRGQDVKRILLIVSYRLVGTSAQKAHKTVSCSLFHVLQLNLLQFKTYSIGQHNILQALLSCFPANEDKMRFPAAYLLAFHLTRAISTSEPIHTHTTALTTKCPAYISTHITRYFCQYFLSA
jgi:hypothetical protein